MNKSNEQGIERIIEKIRGLLNIARDKKSDAECKSALLMAQRLMVKHNIDYESIKEINDDVIVERYSKYFKRMKWYERELASIIATNFRCKYYRTLSTPTLGRRYVFIGLESDSLMATEMYELALEALTYHTEMHLREYAINRSERKKAYMMGFLQGVKSAFEEQISTLRNEFGLVVLVPESVQNYYEELDLVNKKYSVPNRELLNPNVANSMKEGYEKGSSLDFTKSKLEENN